ncbi:MAG: maltose alpha-D-glucosyltransferase [Proteobacteria bacterium]|nr:maltose alpha-D-glucosyltransferase [Pseudomonadota bacterium]
MTKVLKKDSVSGDDPLWYKDAIIYQLHVKTFFDRNNDGIGDFKGLCEKLDYLQDLGVTAIWLLPFYPSPLKDDGYDISDYTSIHPSYGKLQDFKKFMREAHRRELRVITELVINHTSDQHSWFQHARRAKPGSAWRNFYVWNDTPDRFQEARIIFQDFESSNWAWDPVSNAYYWHRFYSHQPDLNYDNPKVHRAIFKVLDFWLAMGVDGMRLDAVPYLFEREGTNCENLPETHEFLKRLRGHLESRYPHRMLLGEANQWPEDAVAYFGDGDEVHMAFHFPLMPRLFMALQMEDRLPLVDILEQTPAIPDACQWAVFLRNHDELTLEMVTDEERDYMYRAYGHDPRMRLNQGICRRLAPLLGNHRRRIELMNGILFSVPGTPVIYYGDEIGMGDNVYLGDRNGVRTPMHWSADRNAGFSGANPQQLYLPIIIDPEYHYEVINVQTQQNNPHSLLWWMKRLIMLRKRFKAFSRGTMQFLHPDNPKIFSFIRAHDEERILVVANLSRFVQYVELDLSAYRGATPIEIFGRTKFPGVGENPYPFTLGPHAFYWFLLQPPESRGPEEAITLQTLLSTLEIDGKWERIFSDRKKHRLENLLGAYLGKQRWFGGKARQIKFVRIQELIPLPQHKDFPATIALVAVDYLEGDPETYVLPLSYATGKQAEEILRLWPHLVVARLFITDKKEEGILFDPFTVKAFGKALLETMARWNHRKGADGKITISTTRMFKQIVGPLEASPEPSILKAEQSNTSLVYGNKYILKLFRRFQPGINPDLEIGRFLTEKGFRSIPPLAGAIEYRKDRQEPATLAILQGFVQNQGDAWQYTLDMLAHSFEHVLTQPAGKQPPPTFCGSILDLVDAEPPPEIFDCMGSYVESARLLGQRTGELHLALCAAGEHAPQFVPEPFSKLYQRSLYQSMRTLTEKNLLLLGKRLKDLPQESLAMARNILERKQEILGRFRALLDIKITAMRMRCHGDYHLGQVLYTGNDFVIIDFEGEPARTISERRIKRSPLRDVAGMLRSFHYVVHTALLKHKALWPANRETLPYLDSWGDLWQIWVSAIFLKFYLKVCDQGDFLPQTRQELNVLLDAYLLEKAIYEMGYELNNRPGWIQIPLQGIQRLLDAEQRT